MKNSILTVLLVILAGTAAQAKELNVCFKNGKKIGEISVDANESSIYVDYDRKSSAQNTKESGAITDLQRSKLGIVIDAYLTGVLDGSDARITILKDLVMFQSLNDEGEVGKPTKRKIVSCK